MFSSSGIRFAIQAVKAPFQSCPREVRSVTVSQTQPPPDGPRGEGRHLRSGNSPSSRRAAPSGGPGSTRKRRRWRRRLLRLSITFVALLLVVAGLGLGYYEYRNGQLHHVVVRHLHHQAPGRPENILMIGSNSRCALNGKQASQFGTCSEVGGARSDVTMLLHLDPVHHTAAVLSIPRDLFLPIPGKADANRVDDALNAGPSQLVQTIEADLGIPINHFIELNFDTFQGVVNVLGGVSMYFPDPLKDSYSNLNITTTGCQHLNGTQALAVVRARHLQYFQNGTWNYDPTGDIGRISRDHEFLRILATAVKKSGLGNPLRDNALVGSVLPDLTVDSGMSLKDLASLALTYHSLNPNKVPTNTLPVINRATTYYYNGANYGTVVMPYQPQDSQAINSFLGTPDPAGSNVTPGSVTVAVENGSGTPGQAGSTSSALQALGYDVVGTGNTSPVSTFAETTVYYAPGKMADAQSVMNNLSGVAAMGQGPTIDGSDVTVVTGSFFQVASPQASTTSTSTGSSASSGSSSGSAPSSSPVTSSSSTVSTSSNGSTSSSSSTGSGSSATTSGTAPAAGAPTSTGPASNWVPVPGLSSSEYSLITTTHQIPSYDPRACPASG